MIGLDNIQRRYGSDDVETTALRDIDLEVDEGEFLAVMRPSGCGKSTLLNTLGTVDRPTGGRYLFGERDLAALKEKELATFRCATLGFVFQSFNLIDELTIEENVALGLAYRTTTGDRRSRIDPAMDKVGIAHRARNFPHWLSGGKQQRAALAHAIVGDPRPILADEPTGNLDTANGEQVMNILAGLNDADATIAMVTHSPCHADIAKRRVDMLDGRIVTSAARAV